MAWQYSVLVVANVTADSPDLLVALKALAERGACRFTLLVPAAAAGKEAREAAQKRLDEALGHMREAGLEVEGRVGDPDPVAAVHEAWDPMSFDEVVISTLPTGTSKWLQVDLPHRVEKLTGVSVQHVVSTPAPPEPRTEPAPAHEDHGVLAPLAAALGGRRKRG